MNVVVDSLIHADPRYLVFRGVDGSGQGSRYISRSTMPRCPQPGEAWSLNSTVETHPKYGVQRVVAAGAKLLRPNGDYIRALLAKHPLLRGLGIGNRTATALYETWGSELVGILDRSDHQRLEPTLNYEAAVELCQRWKLLSLEPELLRWLDEHAIDGQVAAKLVAVYGASATDAITANPYVLLPFFPFTRVDAVARANFGVQSEDPRRQIAAVEEILFRAMVSHGHTAMAKGDIVCALARTFRLGEEALQLAIANAAVFAVGTYIRCYAADVMEREVESRIRAAFAPKLVQSEFWLSAGKPSMEDRILAESRRMGFMVTCEQKNAVLGALTNRIACILGGAGVGKTTVLRLLAAVIGSFDGRAVFLAVTGRATKRICESLGPELETSVSTVFTVARFLTSKVRELDPDSAPWLIVDEASMLDLQSAHRLITRSPRHARLVFVGDPGQLPPAGAGLVYHRLVDTLLVPRTELSVVFRQAAETGIPAVASHVRLGEFYPDDFPPFKGAGQGVQMQPAAENDAVVEAIRIRNLMAAHGEVQILTIFRAKLGAQEVNATMQVTTCAATLRLEGFLSIAVGEPVIYLANDPDLDLQNGSVGRVESISLEPREVSVKWDDGVLRVIKGANLLNLELAHGITVHKAQGSGYERVVIVVPRRSRILDRSLLYTAITRARKQAVIVGDLDAVREAIRAEPTAKRRVVRLLVAA
jgi:exodeoxyribonuclease V alpha subunit